MASFERPAVQSTGLAAACDARLRRDKLLVYAAHSGFGNQELSLRRALLLAYVLNRTLVLPPLLPQSELAFGPPEVRCANASWQAYLQSRAESAYATRKRAGTYEPLSALFDFAPLGALGVRTVDFSSLPLGALDGAPLAPYGCSSNDRHTAASLRRGLRPAWAAPAVRLGSSYFLKADLFGLQASDPCFAAVRHPMIASRHRPRAPRAVSPATSSRACVVPDPPVLPQVARAVLALPFSSPVHRAATSAVALVPKPYAAVHVRLSDSGVAAGGAAGDARNKLSDELTPTLRWLRSRIVNRLATRQGAERAAGSVSVFVASNVPGGVRSAALAPLCSGATGLNCSDQGTLRLRETKEFVDLLVESVGGTVAQSGASRGELDAGTAALLLDQAVSAAAGQGFFSASKYCGPAGHRRSTFSEAIALRWAQLHGAQPLCAHAMEHALLKGWAAHGSFVY